MSVSSSAAYYRRRLWVTVVLASSLLLGAVSCSLQAESATNSANGASTSVGASTAQVENPAKIAFFAMDTYMEITAYGADAALLEKCQSEVLRLEKLMSATDTASELYVLNERKTLKPAPELLEILRYALEQSAATRGSFDISVRPLMEAWGFGTEAAHLPDRASLAAILPAVNYQLIQASVDVVNIPADMKLDLGAIAKGYATDRVKMILQEAQVTTALINLGGNVYAMGAKPGKEAWSIGLRSEDGEALAGTLSLKDSSVVSSGTYERNFIAADGNKYWHILDPATGMPAGSAKTMVSIVCQESARADALSTALFVMGPEQAEAYWRSCDDFEYIYISDDPESVGAVRLHVTEGIATQFQVSERYPASSVTIVRR